MQRAMRAIGLALGVVFVSAGPAADVVKAVDPQLANEIGPLSRSDNRMRRKSENTGRVTGPVDRLQDIVSGQEAGTMIIRLSPKTAHPAGNYNHGECYSAADISGETLTLRNGGPCLTFWNVELLNWQDNPTLRAWQGRVRADDYSTGSGAALTNPAIACSTISDCTAAYGEVGALCSGGICRPAWRNLTRADGFGQINEGCDPALWDMGFNPAGVLFFGDQGPDEPQNGLFCALSDVGQVEYGGTLAIQVPSGAEGTYTVGWIDEETFYTGPDLVEFAAIQVPGIIVIAQGSCCFGLNGPSAGCTDGLFESECDALAQPTHWVQGGVCASPPSASGCGSCSLDAECNDVKSCTTDVCLNDRCAYINIPTACDDQDACTDNDHCALGVCQGDVIMCCGEPDGTGCDDGLFCTGVDLCTGESCVGGATPCATDQWCNAIELECEADGDFNGNGTVNLADYKSFRNCLAGPNLPVSPVCQLRCDFNGDLRVDLLDAAEFMTGFSGP